MSIKDYKQQFLVINGTTNEQIKVPKTYNSNSFISARYMIDDILLFDTIKQELENNNSVTIIKTYMKE